MKHFKVEIELEKKLRKQIYDAIQGPVIESLQKQLSNSYSDIYWKSTMEGHSFKVEKKMMGHIYDLCYGVKESLGYTEPVDFYITGDASVNAFSVASEKDGEPNIVNINSALVELMSDDELRFVIGHEIGHLINRDTHFKSLLAFVFPEGTEAPIILQYRIRLCDQLCELVADRYGYLAIPDIKACVSAFFKMSSGLDINKLDVEVEALIEENKTRLEYFLKGEGISSASHPVNPIRIEALNLFATCKTQKELKKAMEELISILLKVGTSEADRHMPAFIASAGLIMASADEPVGKEEYDEILTTLSSFHMFPKDYLEDICKMDVYKVFEDSVTHILETEPALREGMFAYVLKIAVSDKKFSDDEIKLIYEIGMNVFGYSEKEVAQMFASTIQLSFVPDIEDIS